MLNQLTQLDLELLGETVTHGHQEKEGCTADMNSNATNSDLVMSLESQYIMVSRLGLRLYCEDR